MVDTALAIEALVQRFGGHVCSKIILFTFKKYIPFVFILENDFDSYGKKGKKKAATYAFSGHGGYDAPTLIICSLAEIDSPTPSTELQTYKNMGVSYKLVVLIYLFFICF